MSCESEPQKQGAAPSPTPDFPAGAIPCQVIYAQPPGDAGEDEIDLLDLWRIIWRGRKLIISVTLIVAFLTAGLSLLLPNIYRAEVLLAPAQQDKGNGGLSAALGGLGGLASLAGISVGGSSADEAIAVLKSSDFLWDFIKQHKLMPVLFADDWDSANKRWRETDPEKQPNLWDAYRLLSEDLTVSTDKKNGLVHLKLEWKDPTLAANWANLLVAEVNAYMRRQEIERTKNNLSYLEQELAKAKVAEQRQALFELVSQQQQKAMLANTQKDFAFRVLNKATPPDKEAKPKRALMVVLAAFLAAVGSVLFALIREKFGTRG